jgi:hypothetical protein
MKNETIAIICPPLSLYPEPLPDQSECEEFDCPRCKEKMWLSKKKKGIILFSACLNNNIILACYTCFTKMVIEDPELLKDSKMLEL